VSTPQVPFEPLAPGRAAQAVRLSATAGWNQTEHDWQRVARLCPGSSGVWFDLGLARASYSVVPYGKDACWIGMILVDPEYQGKGLGKAAFAAALKSAQELGCRVQGLDATDLGAPIYLKFGFVGTVPVSRWSGRLKPSAGPLSATSATPADWQALCDFDRCQIGLDRSGLLLDLLGSPEVNVWVTRDAKGALDGYATLRPGRNAPQLGPLVSAGEAQFEALAGAAAAAVGEQEVRCDCFDQRATPALLKAMGLTQSRQLLRMTQPADDSVLAGPDHLLCAGFEWG